MKKYFPGLLLSLVLGLVFGMVALIWFFFFANGSSPKRPVLLCTPGTPTEQCQLGQAIYSLDGMDGMWTIDKLWLPDGQMMSFTGTECWIKISGGACEASGPNSERADFDALIVPLAN